MANVACLASYSDRVDQAILNLGGEGGEWRRLTSADKTRFLFTVPRARQRYRPDAGVDRLSEVPRPIGRALLALAAQ